MNKADLIEALAPRLGGRAAATAALEAFVDVVLREVAGGGSVGITGFGTFEQVDRAPRTGRNPRTGEAVPIAGTSSPRFRPGSYFKDVVSDPTTLPAEGLAGVRGAVAERVETPSEGAPQTVRRSGSGGASARVGADAEAAPEVRSAETPAPSGTPSTVRKEKPEPARDAPEDAQPAADPGSGALTDRGSTATKKGRKKGGPPSASPGGRVFAGGEDITASMITAKKAQLARVKNDEKAKRAKKKDAKATKKTKGKGKSKSKKKD